MIPTSSLYLSLACYDPEASQLVIWVWFRNRPYIIGKMLVPLKWYPSYLTPKEPLKRGYTPPPPKKIPTIYGVYSGFLKMVVPNNYWHLLKK